MKTFFSVLFAFLFCQAYAQQYLPFLTEGKVWHCISHDDEPHDTDIDVPYILYVHSDTVVGDQTCKKIYYDNGKNHSENPGGHYNDAGWEEEGKLYHFETYTEVIFDEETGDDDLVDVTAPVLICDIGLNVGDSAMRGVVTQADTIEIRGVQRKRIVVNNYDKYVWVEGIGFNTSLWPSQMPKHGSKYSYIDSCYVNGELIFTKDDFFAPAVTDGISTLTVSKRNDGKTYDLQGRMVEKPTAKGIYIKNGRKFVKN